MHINRRMLARREACDEQRELFKRTFPINENIPVNEANLRKAYQAGLSMRWLMMNYGKKLQPWRQVLINMKLDAWEIAVSVDSSPQEDTKALAIKQGRAFSYASYFGLPPCDILRAAAIQEGRAYHYAVEIDKCARPDTYNAIEKWNREAYERILGRPIMPANVVSPPC